MSHETATNTTQETKEINPFEMVQKSLAEFGKTHTRGEVIAVVEFLVGIGILPQGYSMTIQFGLTPEQLAEKQEQEEGAKDDTP